MAHVFIGLGSNLGDRQANILQALQRLRTRTSVRRVSSFYETVPMGHVAGPAFLNAAAEIETDLEPRSFESFVRHVELAIGRQRGEHFSARAIDIDILLIDDLVADFGRFAVPHPYLDRRPFNLIPLAEIAPDAVDRRTEKTIARMAAEISPDGVVRKVRSLHFAANRQEEEPDVRLSLNRVGVSGIKRVVRFALGGKEIAFNGTFAMVADLRPDQAGVHMSRFSELLEEAILEVLDRTEGGRIDDVVGRIAHRVVASQRAIRADVRLRADFGLERWTPVSAMRGEESYTLVAVAHADTEGSRRAVGVEAEGMTACPCAQLMVREHSLRELIDAGFTEADANRALDALPVATHNQRGRGTVLIGADDARISELAAEDLVEIVESSMSSETYDLLKRPDEFFIVNKAHHNPKFVEDVVRGILARALDVYPDFPDETFIAASQVNYESIHKHDAFAEAFGTFGEFRRELRDRAYVVQKTDLAAWLGTRPSAVTT